jgi:hypothetical protein
MGHDLTSNFDWAFAVNPGHVGVGVAPVWQAPAACLPLATKRIRTQSRAAPGGLSAGGLDT